MSARSVKALAVACLLVLSSCGTGRPGSLDQTPPAAGSAQLEARLGGCTFDPATGMLMADVLFEPTADAPSSIQEVASQLRVQTYQLMQVTDGSPAPVTEEFSVLARHRPKVSLSVDVGERPPTTLLFGSLELSVESPASISADSPQDLVGKSVSTPFGEAQIEAVDEQRSELRIDLVLTPARVSDELAAAGTTEERLPVNGDMITSTGSSLTPRGDAYSERLTFMTPVPLEGPIALDIEGWSIRSLAPIGIDLPANCGA